MIRGSFDRGRPVVECRLVIPRLSVNHRLMLLVDTGASASCLHPADAIRAGIPFEELGNRGRLSGHRWIVCILQRVGQSPIRGRLLLADLPARFADSRSHGEQQRLTFTAWTRCPQQMAYGL